MAGTADACRSRTHQYNRRFIGMAFTLPQSLAKHDGAGDMRTHHRVDEFGRHRTQGSIELNTRCVGNAIKRAIFFGKLADPSRNAIGVREIVGSNRCRF